MLGDPHLGRRFVNNVPLHRRGDHETAINNHFREHMIEAASSGLDFHVNMGDLFDRPVVTPETVALAADVYREAAILAPNTKFIVLAGNHDLSRDVDAVNSFDLFARIVGQFGVISVNRETYVKDNLAFVPFSPAHTATEMVGIIKHFSLDAAFGHWDLVNPASDHNMVPKLNTKLYVTGHDHLGREEERHGVRTICTGSMLAFAHGEGEPYRTVTLAELELISPVELYGLCVRVVLKEGEELPVGLDALQVGFMREKQGDTLDLDLNVEFEGFDMASIFTDTMTKHGVSTDLTGQLFERYRGRA